MFGPASEPAAQLAHRPEGKHACRRPAHLRAQRRGASLLERPHRRRLLPHAVAQALQVPLARAGGGQLAPRVCQLGQAVHQRAVAALGPRSEALPLQEVLCKEEDGHSRQIMRSDNC